ncbi:MAG: GNAT family N-acetyltransferase [Promethearchaeota archaeon]
MQQIIDFQNTQVIFREYNCDLDPPKLVIHLFDQMNSEEGILKLREGDSWLHDSLFTRVRLVAEIDGELCATYTLQGCRGPTPNDKFNLYSVVTAPSYRGTGLSRLMFNFVCKWAKEHGGRMLLIETWDNNYVAKAFYEKMGFNQYGILPNGLVNLEGEGYVDEIHYYFNLNA